MLAVGQFTIYDLNDIVPSDTEPKNPIEGMIWLKTSGDAPYHFYVYRGGSFERTNYESLQELDPGQNQKVEGSYQEITNLQEDSKLTRYERSVVRGELAKITGTYLSSSGSMPTLSSLDNGGVGDVYTLRKKSRELALPTSDNDYQRFGQAYTDLRSYLSGLSIKAWDINSEGTVTLNPTQWDSVWNEYQVAYNVLQAKNDVREKQFAQEEAKDAYDEAKKYADSMKETIDGTITTTQKSVSNLSTYVDNSFKDSVIEESEAKSIEKYLNTLRANKENVDGRYSELYGNGNLSSSVQSTLQSKKKRFNNAHDNLTSAINSAIADGKTTTSESSNVDSKFSAYTTALSELSTSLENAVDNIAQNKVNDLEIGGVNLFKDSSFEDINVGEDVVGSYNNLSIHEVTDEVSRSGSKSYKVKANNSTNGYKRFYNDGSPFVEAVFGEKVTVSMYVYRTGDYSEHITIGMNGHNVTFPSSGERSHYNDDIPLNEWTRISTTFTIKETGTYWAFIQYMDALTYVDDVQVEKGDKATGYSPAPEDYENSISNNTQLIKDSISDVIRADEYNEVNLTNPVTVSAPVSTIALPYFEGRHVDGWEFEGRNLFLGYDFVEQFPHKYSFTGDFLTIHDTDSTGGHTIAHLEPETDYVISFSEPMHDRFNGVSNKTWVGNKVMKFTTDSGNSQGVFIFTGKFYPLDTNSYPLDTQIKLEKGSEPTPYTPAPEDTWHSQNRIRPITTPTFNTGTSMTFNAGFYGDGTTNDEFRWTSQGEPVKVKKWEDILLDGSFDWEWHRSYDSSNHKLVRIPINNIFNIGAEEFGGDVIVKYDGSLVSSDTPNKDFTTHPDQFRLGDWTSQNGGAELGISIANEDSGWGNGYTPTPEEISAYFNGWKMCDGNFDSPYTGSGNKVWYPIGDTNLDRSTKNETNGDTIYDPVPEGISFTIQEGTINHYQMVYQLETPEEVSVTFDGIIKLIQGDNAISIDYPDGTPEIETGKIRYATNLATSTQDTQNLIPSIQRRLSNAEEVITDDSIVNTVMNSTEYELTLQDKADVGDLGNLATQGELDDTKQDLEGQLSNAIDNIDFSPYVTQSDLEQTATDITAKFSATGGMNLIKNSIGFSDLDFWSSTKAGTVQTLANQELDKLGFGSGFYFKSDGLQKDIRQTISVDPNQIYTLSWYMNKITGGSSYKDRLDIQIMENGVIKQEISDNRNEVTSGFENQYMTYTPETSEITIVFRGYDDTEVMLTGIMFTIGDTPLQWSLATGELYNTNIRMDLNGLRVSQFDEDGNITGYTQMTPEEFAGYYDSQGNGTFDKIFYFNGDETVTKKVRAKEEISMGDIKIIRVNGGGHSGWAFISTSDE